MGTDKNNLRDHEIDGIREFDNDLPKWWLYSFYICIVFAVIYMGYYHLGGPGKTAFQTFDEQQKIDSALVAQTAAATGSAGKYNDEQKLNESKTNKAVLAKGAESFQAKCLACHGNAGQGGVGPNLTDDFWLHGGKLVQIAKTIHDGVPEKGMIAWGASLPDEEIIALTVFIKSLRGTNPPNAKPPQGDRENE